MSNATNTKKWSLEEETIVCERHREFGNKWAEIAKGLSSRQHRGDKQVKNYFYSSIRKYIRKVVKGKISIDLCKAQLRD